MRWLRLGVLLEASVVVVGGAGGRQVWCGRQAVVVGGRRCRGVLVDLGVVVRKVALVWVA